MQAEGFSPAIIQRFFQPFLGGIFFDSDLSVTSRLFAYVMRCLATGANCLPAQGIGAVSEQLASHLPETAIHTGKRLCGHPEDSYKHGALMSMAEAFAAYVNQMQNVVCLSSVGQQVSVLMNFSIGQCLSDAQSWAYLRQHALETAAT